MATMEMEKLDARCIGIFPVKAFKTVYYEVHFL